MTTYVEFINGLRDLALSGVTNLTGPPTSLNTADLPAKWVQLPQAREGGYTFQYNGGWPAFRADVVVALTPASQGTQNENWAETIAMLDTLATALRDADVCESELSWTLRQDGVRVGGQDYWAVVASVEGSG